LFTITIRFCIPLNVYKYIRNYFDIKSITMLTTNKIIFEY